MQAESLITVITGAGTQPPTLTEVLADPEMGQALARARVVLTADKAGQTVRLIKDNVGSYELTVLVARALGARFQADIDGPRAA